MLPIDEIKKIPFFFVIGRPRSGTTLLRTLLDAHPNISVPFESPFVLNLKKKYGKITQWNPKLLGSFWKDLQHEPKFSTWTIDKSSFEKFVTEFSGTLTYQELCKIVYCHYQSVFEKENLRALGDKTPLYSLKLKQLFKLFPNSKYIYIVRDYRDNIVSLKKFEFEGPWAGVLAYRWKYSLKSVLSLKKKYPNQFFIVRYEDLVQNPEEEINKVFSFLKIEYKYNIFDYYKKISIYKALSKRDGFDKFHENLFNPVNTSRINLWKKELSKNDIKISEYISGRIGSELKYESIYNVMFYTVIRAIPQLIYGFLSIAFIKGIDKLPYPISLLLKNGWFKITKLLYRTRKKL